MVLTPEMLREVAKDLDMVASSHLGRQSVKTLLTESAVEIERLRKVNSDMATAFADRAHGDRQSAESEELEAAPPTEKEMAREMAPTLKGKKHKK